MEDRGDGRRLTECKRRGTKRRGLTRGTSRRHALEHGACKVSLSGCESKDVRRRRMMPTAGCRQEEGWRGYGGREAKHRAPEAAESEALPHGHRTLSATGMHHLSSPLPYTYLISTLKNRTKKRSLRELKRSRMSHWRRREGNTNSRDSGTERRYGKREHAHLSSRTLITEVSDSRHASRTADRYREETTGVVTTKRSRSNGMMLKRCHTR